MESYVGFLKPVQIKGKVRLGNNFDGGYVVYENALLSTDVLFSYGVGWDTGFEEHFNLVTGKKVYMFDPTMYNGNILSRTHLFKLLSNLQLKAAYDYSKKCFAWSRHLERLSALDIHFFQEGLSDNTTDRYDKFENHKLKTNSQAQILLKIDIEGGEYDVFVDESFYDSLHNVNQIVVEFHDLKNRLLVLREIIKRLSAHFELIHLHGNNWGEIFTIFDFEKGSDSFCLPDVAEFTFVRENKILGSDFLSRDEIFPLDKLDYPNNPNRKEYYFSLFK